MNSLVGTVFQDRYEILEVLGSGGTSVVYKARDKVLNRLVTIKILRKQFAEDEKFVLRFRNEAQAVAKLSHPNIVRIYDVAFSGDMHYLVMEYVDGCSLKEYIDQNVPLPIDESLRIFEQLLSALQHAHENNVIHRDIKPHNILLDTKHNVRVTDFGLAVTAGNLGIEAAAGDIMGSIYYMSPEQIKGETVSNATDIYSAGVLLYEMLCACRPFSGKTAVDIARQHLKSNPMPPHKINPDISRELSSFTMKAIRRDMELRFSDTGQMLVELRAIMNKDRAVSVQPLNLDISSLAQTDSQHDNEQEEDVVVVKRHFMPPEDMEPPKTAVFFRDKKPTPLFLMIVFALLLLLTFGVSMFSILNSLNGDNTEIAVRELRGMTLTEAQEALEADLLQYTVSYAYSDEHDKDIVISQSIMPGQKVKSGRTVELTVSQGSKTFFMPMIEGMTLSEARVTLNSYKVTLESTEVVDEAVAAGRIISQDPAADTEIAAGSVVKVTVSKGKEITVPDLRGRTEDDAMVYLVLQGLTLGEITREESLEYEEGYVIGQSLTAGEAILEGSSIDLVVSSGPGPENKNVRVSYTLPAGEEREYNIRIEIIDSKGTREEYNDRHQGGETIVRDVTIWGDGTVNVYLDGDLVYNQDVV